MAEFYRWLIHRGKPWPNNLIPMASILNAAYARQAVTLLEIPAPAHGFSVEPLDAPLELPEELMSAAPWIILGGESGRAAIRHPFDIAWARSIRDQCFEAEAPFFLKQLGGAPVDRGARLHLNDKHGGDWDEWPEDIKIRQLPDVFRMRARAGGEEPRYASACARPRVEASF